MMSVSKTPEITTGYRYDTPSDLEASGKWRVPEISSKLADLTNKYTTMRDFRFKNGDIIVATFPRSGTHLIWHLCRWLVQGDTTPVTDPREESHFPYLHYHENQEHLPRRVLNTHELPNRIGHDVILTGKYKVVNVYRNPKDNCVSYYNMYKDLSVSYYVDPGDFRDYALGFCTEVEQSAGGNWVKNVRAWEEFTDKNPEANVLILCYENVVKNPEPEIRKLATFLEINASDDLIKNCADSCTFDNLSKSNVDGRTLAGHFAPNRPTFFRKDSAMTSASKTPEITTEYKYDTPSDLEASGKWRVPEISSKLADLTNKYTTMKDFRFKDGDIIVATFPRSGTHLIWHLCRWLVQGDTTPVTDPREESHFPYLHYHENQEHLPRRVLNTHELPNRIGHDVILSGKYKVVNVYRNPKDNCVSYYNMYKDLSVSYFVDPGDFRDYALGFCTEVEQSAGGNWVKNVRAWEEFTDKNPEANVLILCYENVVKNPEPEIRKLATFLEINASDDLIKNCADSCTFDNLSKSNVDGRTLAGHFAPNIPTFFRKGRIGAWKDWFTVALSERFDDEISKRIQGVQNQFIYY